MKLIKSAKATVYYMGSQKRATVKVQRTLLKNAYSEKEKDEKSMSTCPPFLIWSKQRWIRIPKQTNIIVDIPISINDNFPPLSLLYSTYPARDATHCVSFFSFDSHPLYSIVLFPASPFVDNILWLCHTSVLYTQCHHFRFLMWPAALLQGQAWFSALERGQHPHMFSS